MIRAARLLAALGRVRTWLLRLVISFLMLAGFLPPPLLLLWLEWLHEDMAPDHPAMDTVLAEIAQTREMCRA